MTSEVHRYALIVAGGTGTRMESSVPKQFMLLRGKPVLMHTIGAFAAVPGVEIIVVLPSAQHDVWSQLCDQFTFDIPHKTVSGGDTRFHSVRNGLEHISTGLVAIHDGVRPLAGRDLIDRAYEMASLKGNAIAAVKLKDSIREMMLTGRSRSVNRNNYYLVQTPQVFDAATIKKAYSEAGHYNFTDDAGVLEEAGGTIHLVEGSYSNIKITTPEDMYVAEALMASRISG